MEQSGISSKWLIHGFDEYFIGDDKKLYRFPFKSGKNHYGVREIKLQYPNRFKLKGIWYSKDYLRKRVYKNPQPEIMINCKDLPF